MRLVVCSVCFAFVLLSNMDSTVRLVAQEKPRESPEQQAKNKKTAANPEKEQAAPDKDGWRSLLAKDGTAGWRTSEFGGDGEFSVKNGELLLEAGQPLTGVTYTKEFPKTNFEIRVEAKRIEGGDFFCGLTFPVGDGHASLICGGWGGGVVGLSSVDGYDASENSTSTYEDFKNDQWYRFRIRVDNESVTAWINDKEMFSQEREGHKFTVRGEVLASRPLGYCVFQSKVAVRNFQWRPIPSKSK